jgi:hypothetical protein
MERFLYLLYVSEQIIRNLSIGPEQVASGFFGQLYFCLRKDFELYTTVLELKFLKNIGPSIPKWKKNAW